MKSRRAGADRSSPGMDRIRTMCPRDPTIPATGIPTDIVSARKPATEGARGGCRVSRRMPSRSQTGEGPAFRERLHLVVRNARYLLFP